MGITKENTNMGDETMTTATKRTWVSVKGTEISVGDQRIGGGCVVRIEPGQLAAGARYVDVILDTDEVERCWEGFRYRVAR